MINTQAGSVSKAGNLALNLAAATFGIAGFVCLEETLRHTSIGHQLHLQGLKEDSTELIRAGDAEQSLGKAFALASVSSLVIAGASVCKNALKDQW